MGSHELTALIELQCKLKPQKKQFLHIFNSILHLQIVLIIGFRCDRLNEVLCKSVRASEIFLQW